jgi:hypothetical protein
MTLLKIDPQTQIDTSRHLWRKLSAAISVSEAELFENHCKVSMSQKVTVLPRVR